MRADCTGGVEQDPALSARVGTPARRALMPQPVDSGHEEPEYGDDEQCEREGRRGDKDDLKQHASGSLVSEVVWSGGVVEDVPDLAGVADLEGVEDASDLSG